jgi:Fe-S-cluster-containing dehydrogenase component/CRP-like cAMP-binding protein
MAEAVYPVADLLPGKDDLPLSPMQFLSIPYFASLGADPQKKLRQCAGALVLRCFGHAGEDICRQGAAGVSAFFALTEADIYGLYQYVEERIAQAEKSPKQGDKFRAYLDGLVAVRNAYRRRLAFLNDPERSAVMKAAHVADRALAQRSRPDAGSKLSPEAEKYRRLAAADARAKLAEADKVASSDPELTGWLRAAAAGNDTRPVATVHREGDARQGRMYERELFGEMACRNRQPRAATVRTARPCYVVELLGNVLALLEQDPWFKEVLADTYDRRIMELHLRGLSLLRHLEASAFDRFYDQMQARYKVAPFNPQAVICEEGQPSDCVYLIRSGWVQVRKKTGPDSHWVLGYRGPGEFIGEMGLIRTPEQTEALRKGDFTSVLRTRPEPGPRTATCVAWAHPTVTSGRVELIRIPYEDFWELIKASEAIRKEIATEVDRRRREQQMPPAERVTRDAGLFSPHLLPLGLYQGRQLMLIDLDRCTRCDECVHACVAAHPEEGGGRSRLFLQGEQAVIGSRTYLVPATCRSCEDPVCMIGCPTRAIRRGGKGEMTIDENTCIGCKGCANKCPYNAIQMHDVGVIPAEADDWYYARLADLGTGRRERWRRRTSPPRGWGRGRSPFKLDYCFRTSFAAPAPPADTFGFWRAFTVGEKDGGKGPLVLEVTLAGDSPPEQFKVWVDGRECRPENPTDEDKAGLEKPKKAESGKAKARKLTYAVHVAPRMALGWRRDVHVLALEAVPGGKPGEKFLEVRLDRPRPLYGPWDVQDDLTEAKGWQPYLAVVCDLCRELPTGPACVRACPHNATARFDGRAGVVQEF